LVPEDKIIAADLTDWQYRPRRDFVAVDPVLGRIAFPPNQLPKKVRVAYHYAFSADMGGGAYDRPRVEPAYFRLYRVGEHEPFKRIKEAWDRWQAQLAEWPADKPQNAIIEIADSNVYVEQLLFTLEPGQSLQIRAARHTRPVIRLLDWQTDISYA
jgi:hypothetical protein